MSNQQSEKSQAYRNLFLKILYQAYSSLYSCKIDQHYENIKTGWVARLKEFDMDERMKSGFDCFMHIFHQEWQDFQNQNIANNILATINFKEEIS